MTAPLRLVTGILALLALTTVSGCLHLQLGGVVTASTVSVTPLRDPSPEIVIEQRSVDSLEAVIEKDTQERWDSREDPGKVTFLGNVVLDESLYDPQQLYLVTASGGVDQDADSDNVLDEQGEPVAGQWHAILTGDQLTRGKVSPLTEAAYRYLELNLDELSDAEIKAELDRLAQAMVPDVDASGTFDYEDVLAWHRHFNANTYLRDIEKVNELSSAIRENAPASELRRLSFEVIGEIDNNQSLFTISGTVTTTATMRVDGDTNNSDTTPESNNAISTAQPLSNPVILGGYANKPERGADGATKVDGDLEDYYRLDLLADQQVTLLIAEDPEIHDLDLYLFDEQGVLLDAGLSRTDVEQLTVETDGTYFVAVRVFTSPFVTQTASNYQLSVGIGELTAEQKMSQLRLSDDFVPGEIVAQFGEKHTVHSLRGRKHLPPLKLRTRLGGRAQLLDVEDGGATDRRQQTRKLNTLLALKRLRQQSEVEMAALNYYVKPATVEPNDTFFDEQRWHYEMLNLPAAWDRDLIGDGVIVAVVDTGIRQNHPDMSGQLVAGYDFISNKNTAADGNGIDPNPEDPGDSEDGSPSSFHGTHVAGTIAAASDNVQGVAGVAWNARIMPMRALGRGGGTSVDVREAVRYAAGLSNASGLLPSQAADIINLSLSGGGFSSIDQDTYDEVTARGIIVVAAAGNESSSQFAYPASYDGVVSVSAVNINQERARYSNFGSRIDIAAPGGDSSTNDVNGDGVSDLVLSTGADDSGSNIRDTYTLLEGTSMASPHVAGVVALMKAIYPDLDADEFQDLLDKQLITDDLGSAGRDNTYGWGLINANKAVLVAESLASGSDVLNQPRISTSVSSLNFGNFADVLPLNISNGGTGTLIIEPGDIVTDDPWLSVSPADVNANGVGSYNVLVDRNQLAIGSYVSAINVISTNGGNASVSVIVEKPDPDDVTEGDAGIHYILLIDADTGAVENQCTTDVTGGVYNFEFTNVPPGNYQIFGGSDADNDFLICDPGEACGAWPIFDTDPTVIRVIQDLSGLTFSSSFTTGISVIQASEPASVFAPLRRSSYRPQTESAPSNTGVCITP
jgi:serine protease